MMRAPFDLMAYRGQPPVGEGNVSVDIIGVTDAEPDSFGSGVASFDIVANIGDKKPVPLPPYYYCGGGWHGILTAGRNQPYSRLHTFEWYPGIVSDPDPTGYRFIYYANFELDADEPDPPPAVVWYYENRGWLGQFISTGTGYYNYAVERIWMMFDTRDVPEDAVIDSVALTCWGATYNLSTPAIPVSVYADDWVEDYYWRTSGYRALQSYRPGAWYAAQPLLATGTIPVAGYMNPQEIVFSCTEAMKAAIVPGWFTKLAFVPTAFVNETPPDSSDFDGMLYFPEVRPGQGLDGYRAALVVAWH